MRVTGRPVELDRSCRAILATLLAHAGHDVSKEALLEAGWPRRLVHENSLAKAIGRLRQALGGQGKALIAVYGIGYRLDVAPQRVIPSDGEARGSQPGASLSTPRRNRPAVLLAAGALAAFAVVGSLAWQSQSTDQSSGFRETSPLTGDEPDAIGKLLWVDDHPQNNLYEQRYFKDHRIAVHSVLNSADALRLLSIYRYKVVISDMGRGEDRLAGVKLVEQMRARGDKTPVVIYTVRPDSAEQQKAQHNLIAEAGAQGLVVTPQEVRSVILGMFGDPVARQGT